MDKDDGGPAFPLPATMHGYPTNTDPGMSLRDYFAGQVLAGLAGDPSVTELAIRKGMARPQQLLAEMAYAAADAMLKARK